MPEPKFRHNIQIFMPISFVLLLAAVVVVVVYTTYTIVKPILLQERMYSIQETGKSVVTRINSMLGQTETAASIVGYTAVNLIPNFKAIKRTIPNVFDMDSIRHITAGGGIWPEPFKFDPLRERFSFFWGRDEQGKLVFFDEYNLAGYHREEWYVPVKYLPSDRVFWSRAYIDPYSHEPMVTCSIRMDRDGEFMGVATVDLRLSGLNKLFARASKEISGYIFAVDRNNKFIVFPKEEYVLSGGKGAARTRIKKYISARELAKRHLEFAPISKHLEQIDQTIIEQARKAGNIDKLAEKLRKECGQISVRESLLIAAYLSQPSPDLSKAVNHVESFSVDSDIIFHEPSMVSIFLLPETNWKLVVTVPKKVAAAPVGRITNSIVMSLAVLIVLVLFLAGLSLYHHILRPLRHITNQLKKIEKDSDDLSLELDIPINNELGELAYYFNQRTRELRNSEEKYRTIFNGASEGISLSAINGDFIKVNPRFAEIFGYDSPEDVIKSIKTYDLYVDLADRKRVLSRLRPDGSTVHEEVWLKKKDGTPVLISLNLAPITDNEGQIKYLIAMIQDITRTKELEKELRHAQKMEAIGTLAGGIAHDFNNILAAISGYTELAQLKAKGNSKVLTYLSQIELAAKRAKELVKQILTFSRYSDSKREPQDLASVVDEVLKLLRSSLPASIRIETDIERTAPVLADQSDLHQIVMNLCTNAYQAMKNEGGTLRIRLKDVELSAKQAQTLGLKEGRYALLEVEDSGCGMDEKIVGKIFEPYFTTKEKEGGTGLGLAVVHGIVKGLKGVVRVSSRPGKGSLFTVFIPVLERKDSQKGMSDVGKGRQKVSGAGRKVLFVDDEKMICNIFQTILEEAGFEVRVFEDGKSALEAMKQNPSEWDLLITDMTMPGLSGAELIKEARKLNPDLPVILCSGFSETLTEEYIAKLRPDAFLAKPVNSDELFKEIARIFSQKGAS